jgi:hypothetical protein
LITYQAAKNGLPLYEKTKGLFNSSKVSALTRHQDIGEGLYKIINTRGRIKMVDADLVRRKLSRMNMCLEKLKPIPQKSFEEYASDFYLESSLNGLYS